MRNMTILACAAFAWLGCDGAPSGPAQPAVASDAPKSAAVESVDPRGGGTRLEKFVAHLQRVSSSAQILKEKPDERERLLFALAVDAEGKPRSRERQSLAFRFELVPYKEGMPGGEDGFAALNAKLDVDPSRTVVMAMAFTGKSVDVETSTAAEGSGEKARFESVRILVARDPKEPSSVRARSAVAKLWNLGGDNVSSPYERAAFDAIVLGTRLKRNTSPPSFSDLGSGSWTLLRLVEPAEAYLAIDWSAGIGELFPKVEGVRTEAGEALFKVL